jgi:cell division protein FtsL
MNGFRQLLMRKVRGIRVIDLAAAGTLTLIVLVVYASKTTGGAEASKIADTNRQIATEEQQVRLLRAQQSYLTRPERLRALSQQYLGMAPVSPKHEVTPEVLMQVRAPASPVVRPVSAPVGATR